MVEVGFPKKNLGLTRLGGLFRGDNQTSIRVGKANVELIVRSHGLAGIVVWTK